MCKKACLLVLALGYAGSGRGAIGDPYVGEEPIGWQTSSAVTLDSSDNAGWFSIYGVAGLVNGGAFMNNGAPGSKLPFPGATYTTDGWSHTSDPGNLTWITDDLATKTSRAGINCQAWIEFSFDQLYSLKDITVWNGGMAQGAAPQRSWKETTISWSTNGSTWQSMDYTLNQQGTYDSGGNFFSPSDPAIPFPHKARYVVISGLINYGGTEYMMSEVRFNLAAPSLTIALQGTSLEISWPTNVAGYSLESSAVLGTSASWGPVNGVVNNSVTITNPAGIQFYRLKKQ